METTFTDDSGDVRFSGKIRMGGTAGQVATVQANGTLAPAPIGAAQEVIVGGNGAIADGATGLFTLTHQAGATLLDYTLPTSPTVVDGGAYIITVPLSVAGIAPAGFVQMAVDIAGGAHTAVFVAAGPGYVPVTSPQATLTIAAILLAGDAIAVWVTNANGDASPIVGTIAGGALLVRVG